MLKEYLKYGDQFFCLCTSLRPPSAIERRGGGMGKGKEERGREGMIKVREQV